MSQGSGGQAGEDPTAGVLAGWEQPAGGYGGNKPARWLERCSFPFPGDGPVDLAVSGGPDSMALMVLAAHAGLEATVIHVDHGLRPESHLDAEVVAKAAAGFHFGFESRSVEVEAGPNLEARARQARYGALPEGILTGHTMDDQAETVVLNMLRGAGLDGLSGMRGGGEARVRRPLIGLRRRETAEVCAWAGIEPLVDPTNSDRRFRRNRVRLDVLPLLGEVAGRDLVPVLARQAELLSDEAALLDQLAAGVDPTDAKALRSAPEPLARRAVRRWLRDLTDERHPPSAAEIARVMAVARGTAKACEVAGGHRIRRTGGRLVLVERQ